MYIMAGTRWHAGVFCDKWPLGEARVLRLDTHKITSNPMSINMVTSWKSGFGR